MEKIKITKGSKRLKEEIAHLLYDYSRIMTLLNEYDEDILEFNKIEKIESKTDTIISACLVGVPCRWNGEEKTNKKALKIYAKGNCAAVCPELMAGLGIPRNACERVDGKIVDKNGKDHTKQYSIGAKLALDFIKKNKIKKAILKSGSPTCGCKTIYSGKFDGKKKKETGVFAEMLKKENIKMTEI